MNEKLSWANKKGREYWIAIAYTRPTLGLHTNANFTVHVQLHTYLRPDG